MRDDWLAQDDEALLADCEVDNYRSSGPGGQKRNKTSSAVRLRHQPSGLIAQAVTSRSQHRNKRAALRLLRAKLAVELRRPAATDDDGAIARVLAAPPKSDKARRNIEYLVGIARLLDHVGAAEFAISDAAVALGATTGAVGKALTADPLARRWVNQERQKRGLRPLR